MIEYTLVQIGDYHLTLDGTSGSAPCRVAIEGMDTLHLEDSGNTVFAADGTSYNLMTADGHRGTTLRIRPLKITQAQHVNIKAAIQDAITNEESIALNLQNDLFTRALNVKPAWLPTPIQYAGELLDDDLDGIIYNFAVE